MADEHDQDQNQTPMDGDDITPDKAASDAPDAPETSEDAAESLEEQPVEAATGLVLFPDERIEDLPVESSSVDWVISNCVINLSPEKDRVFSEITRVLGR